MKDKKQTSFGSVDQDLFMRGFFENHPSVMGEGGFALPQTNESREFINTIYPMSDLYTSPLSSLFLIQVQELSALDRRSTWLVRDGLVPLLWFFRRFPEPGDLKTKLLIYEDLISFVPKAWLPHVGSFRIVCEAKPTSNTRLALLGVISEAYCTIPQLKLQIAKIKEIEGTEELKADAFLPVRSAWRDDEVSYHPEYFRVLYTELTSNVRSLVRNEIKSTFDIHNLRVYDLNDRMLLSDNSMVHDLLARGAQWGLAQPLAADEEFVRLSPSHGFAIRSTVAVVSDQSDLEKSFRLNIRYQERLQTALSSRAFKELPWPKWFADWVRTTAHEAPPIVTQKAPINNPMASVAMAARKENAAATVGNGSSKTRANRN